MAIDKLNNVPLVPQYADGVCWAASAMMVYKWAMSFGSTTMNDPMADKGMKRRYDQNESWLSRDNKSLAKTLNMKTHGSIPSDFDGLKDFLHAHGPIWTAVQKNWGGNDYGHVVVIAGVSDTGVWILDPMPVNQGSSKWLTWAQIKKATDGASEADVKYLTAK